MWIMSSGSRATTSHQGQYQGYPYVNPPVFGVPSIDPYTAARWANLPRRPIETSVRIQDQTQSYQNNAKTPQDSISYKSDDEPVLYIDMPEDGESDIYDRRVDTPTQTSIRLNKTKTSSEDEEPVVYIDIPECSGSGVSERRPEVEDGPPTTVVQETIFYDQFKDRRIDVIPLDTRDSDNEYSSSNNSTMRRPIGTSPQRRPLEGEDRINRRPQPPTSLNLWSPGTSMASAETSSASVPRPAPTYPPSYLTPQEYQEAFRKTPEDDFHLSPLPVTEFPEPPPAYTEIDLRSPPPNLGDPRPIPPVTEQPQRTTVIVNENGGLDRKFLMCQQCRVTVQSIVVQEACLGTHLAAVCFLIFGCFPCTILVYMTNYCKGKVHYCPNCNKKISKTC